MLKEVIEYMTEIMEYKIFSIQTRPTRWLCSLTLCYGFIDIYSPLRTKKIVVSTNKFLRLPKIKISLW